MNFTFVKTQLTQFPNIQGWHLKFDPKNAEILNFVHQSVSKMATLRFQRDPHLQRGLERNDDIYALVMEPTSFSARWLLTMEFWALSHTEPVLLNQMGGFMPLDDNVKILEEITTNTFTFPSPTKELKENKYKWEIITISRWRTHWYLSSSKNRTFDKFTSLQNAKNEALKFVTEDKIKILDNPVSMSNE